MAFYHEMITEQSWQELQRLKSEIRFVLIGGWAVYLYTKSLKSKDIDIVISYDQLPILEKKYRLVKNERLYKYEARRGPIEIDVYLPHFSKLGLPLSDLLKNTTALEGFTVLSPEWLTALKLYTLLQRGRSPKGKKDFLDILSLFHLANFSKERVKDLLNRYRLKGVWENFLEHLNEHKELPELNLNAHRYSKIKKTLSR